MHLNFCTSEVECAPEETSLADVHLSSSSLVFAESVFAESVFADSVFADTALKPDEDTRRADLNEEAIVPANGSVVPERKNTTAESVSTRIQKKGTRTRTRQPELAIEVEESPELRRTDSVSPKVDASKRESPVSEKESSGTLATQQTRLILQGATPKMHESATNVGEMLEAKAEAMPLGPLSLASRIVAARVRLHRLLSGNRFDSAIGLVIMVNAIVVGIQVDIDAKRRYQATPDYPILDILEGIFIFVYTAELLLRYFVYRLAAFQNAWVHSAD